MKEHDFIIDDNERKVAVAAAENIVLGARLLFLNRALASLIPYHPNAESGMPYIEFNPQNLPVKYSLIQPQFVDGNIRTEFMAVTEASGEDPTVIFGALSNFNEPHPLHSRFDLMTLTPDGTLHIQGVAREAKTLGQTDWERTIDEKITMIDGIGKSAILMAQAMVESLQRVRR